MNLQSLKYLTALTEHKHFGKAAQACFISQPTLSMQIKKLEDELGLVLAERTNKSVLLTHAGNLIAQHAKNIFMEIQQIKDTASSIKDPYSGNLKLGIIPTLAPYLLPHIMPMLKKNFPKIHYYLWEEKTHVLIEKLKNGLLDACILATPLLDTSIFTEDLFVESFLLAVSKEHPFAQQKQITQKDLELQNLLLLEEGHCLRDQALELCQNIQTEKYTEFRGTSLETLRHMVALGNNLTLIPALACREDNIVHYLDFTEPKPSRNVTLSWRKTSTRSDVFEEMAMAIKSLELGDVNSSSIFRHLKLKESSLDI